jgi:hypothetical protein
VVRNEGGFMGHGEENVEVYRSQLLERLISRPVRAVRGVSDSIQIYVNERRVGELEVAGMETTLHVQSVDHIETVQLRTEDGALVGGLVAPDYGLRRNRLQLSSDTVELCVHNMGQGGSLSAAFIPAPSLWSRAWRGIVSAADRLAAGAPDSAVGWKMRTVAFTQVLLAVAVLGLVADRLKMGAVPEPALPLVVQTATPSPAPVADIARFEQQLDKLGQMQAKIEGALESQQNGVAQLQHAMAKLSSTQESVASSIVMVKEEVREELERRLEAIGREVDRTTRHLASTHTNKGRVDQEQLEAAIRSLTADNDRLSKEVAGLEENNQALTAKLQAAVQNASKAVDPNPDRLLARQADGGRPSLQLADNQQGGQQQPFLFWVTFSEGTTQESIDQWVDGMKGHKGAVNEGWQEVRIVPPPVPPDRFLEQIRGEKIVKAARISQ